MAGKGGSGKSVVAGTLARTLARQGHRVLALDSDLMPGLALSLGVAEPDLPALLGAAERTEGGRWRLRSGIGPVRAVQRFAIAAPDGVRLLQSGKITAEGLAPIMGAVNAYYATIHRIRRSRFFDSWTMIADLPAGPRQTAFDWAPFADMYLLVVEPTWKSALAARRIARIARARGAAVHVVANKVSRAADERWVSRALDQDVIAAIPWDERVRAAELHGHAPIDAAASSRGVRAIEELAHRLELEV